MQKKWRAFAISVSSLPLTLAFDERWHIPRKGDLSFPRFGESIHPRPVASIQLTKLTISCSPAARDAETPP